MPLLLFLHPLCLPLTHTSLSISTQIAVFFLLLLGKIPKYYLGKCKENRVTITGFCLSFISLLANLCKYAKTREVDRS